MQPPKFTQDFPWSLMILLIISIIANVTAPTPDEIQQYQQEFAQLYGPNGARADGKWGLLHKNNPGRRKICEKAWKKMNPYVTGGTFAGTIRFRQFKVQMDDGTLVGPIDVLECWRSTGTHQGSYSNYYVLARGDVNKSLFKLVVPHNNPRQFSSDGDLSTRFSQQPGYDGESRTSGLNESRRSSAARPSSFQFDPSMVVSGSGSGSGQVEEAEGDVSFGVLIIADKILNVSL